MFNKHRKNILYNSGNIVLYHNKISQHIFQSRTHKDHFYYSEIKVEILNNWKIIVAIKN
jgi:hypothetical protein